MDKLGIDKLGNLRSSGGAWSPNGGQATEWGDSFGLRERHAFVFGVAELVDGGSETTGRDTSVASELSGKVAISNAVEDIEQSA